MRMAVFGDIHGNAEALMAFLQDVGVQEVDRYMCLGDIVGYGANPGECLEMVFSLPKLNVILGNHEAAAIWRSSPHAMSPAASKAIFWTMKQLSEVQSASLKTLKPTLKIGDALFAHANPYNPMAWRYVTSRKYAARSFSATREKLLFVGHSHVPLVITREKFFRYSFVQPSDNHTVPVDANGRQIFNCGSIGQPRDGIPKASYLIYDTRREAIEFRRVAYDYVTAADKIRDAGLPKSLAARLSKGR